ncbi:unnamed protein product [Thlaspi arvense]|uniref:Protein pollen defective in guidance 1 n=1 Tax=Thlaspi arvense TaxID=13288 RepID=A0AAU9RU66_THLAR|nr:unnamed protein product [Thlaspi arvense]
MAVRSRGRKLSFGILSATSSISLDDNLESILYRSSSDPLTSQNDDASRLSTAEPKRRKRKSKSSKKKKMIECSMPEDSIPENGSSESNCNNFSVQSTLCEEVALRETEYCNCDGYAVGELRQRSVGGWSEEAVSRIDENAKKESGSTDVDSASRKQPPEPNGNVIGKLETVESLDWKRVMAQDPNKISFLCLIEFKVCAFIHEGGRLRIRLMGLSLASVEGRSQCQSMLGPLAIAIKNLFSVEKSPMRYFLDEMYSGHSLRSTTTCGNDKERERVYDTMFRLPWRCELLIDVGFFVCLDTFLSLLTIMPTRIVLTFWRLVKKRQFERPSAVELSDFGCFIVVACGVALLQQIDISLIYHMIRGQGTIKLYVVYNVLEIFDKLCQSFVGDVLQTLFNTAEGLGNCPPENMRYWFWRFISDEALTVVSSNILA